MACEGVCPRHQPSCSQGTPWSGMESVRGSVRVAGPARAVAPWVKLSRHNLKLCRKGGSPRTHPLCSLLTSCVIPHTHGSVQGNTHLLECLRQAPLLCDCRCPCHRAGHLPRAEPLCSLGWPGARIRHTTGGCTHSRLMSRVRLSSLVIARFETRVFVARRGLVHRRDSQPSHALTLESLWL